MTPVRKIQSPVLLHQVPLNVRPIRYDEKIERNYARICISIFRDEEKLLVKKARCESLWGFEGIRANAKESEESSLENEHLLNFPLKARNRLVA